MSDYERSRKMAAELSKRRIQKYCQFISEQANRQTVLREAPMVGFRGFWDLPDNSFPGPQPHQHTAAVHSVDSGRRKGNPQPGLSDGATERGTWTFSSDGWTTLQKPKVSVPQYSSTTLRNAGYSVFATACREAGARCVFSGWGEDERSFETLVRVPLVTKPGNHPDPMNELLAKADVAFRSNPLLTDLKIRVLSQRLAGDHVEALVQAVPSGDPPYYSRGRR